MTRYRNGLTAGAFALAGLIAFDLWHSTRPTSEHVVTVHDAHAVDASPLPRVADLAVSPSTTSIPPAVPIEASERELSSRDLPALGFALRSEIDRRFALIEARNHTDAGLGLARWRDCLVGDITCQDERTCTMLMIPSCSERIDTDGWLSYTLGSMSEWSENNPIAADDAGTWMSLVILHGVRGVP